MSDRRDGSEGDTVHGPVLAARDVSVVFAGRSRGLRRGPSMPAVRDVSITVGPHETYGLVGESGSGKSTLARALLRLIDVASGSIELMGTEISSLSPKALRPLRRDMQMVFQDPYSSLDPSATIFDILAEPFRVHLSTRGAALEDGVNALLHDVGLSAAYAQRYPYEFSGGQRQRVAVARAIALRPRLVVLDEAVAALDVSSRNHVLGLLRRLQGQLGLAYLFISHDLSVVRWLSDRIGVMYLGKIVEEGPARRVYERPAHPYTQALVAAIPVPDPALQRRRRGHALSGEVPDPMSPPSGCAFRDRCPHAIDICAEVTPSPVEVEGGGWASCHLVAVRELRGASRPPSPDRTSAVPGQ